MINKKESYLLKVRYMELHHVQTHDLDLTPLSHVQEYDKPESQGVDNGSHLISITVCDKVLQYHGSHGLLLKEEQDLCHGDFDCSLKFECQESQAEDDAKENEQKDLREHANVERKKRERQDLVEDDAINDCEKAERQKFVCISLILL